MSIWARLFAALIALAACVGIALYFQAVAATSAWLPAIWALLHYFTITTNILVALTFGGIALGVRGADNPWLVAGVALCIMLVGVIFALLLRGLQELSGGSVTANLLLHQLTPVVVPLFWLVFVRKGALRWRDPFLWALYPIAYLVYALIRGAFEGVYAYPFIDLAKLGVAQLALNVVMITAAFLLAGAVLVWLDRMLARR